MSAPTITRDEWVQRALDAAVDQGHGVAIEDSSALDLIAEVLAHPGAPLDDAA